MIYYEVGINNHSNEAGIIEAAEHAEAAHLEADVDNLSDIPVEITSSITQLATSSHRFTRKLFIRTFLPAGPVN